LLAIVESRVKGKRASHSTAAWWHYERDRGELYEAIRDLERVLCVNCGATPHLGLAMVSGTIVFSHTATVVALPTYAAFAVLQSRLHELWARRESSSMKDDLRYTPSKCFQSFPFPPGFEADPELETAGRAYYDFRGTLMIRSRKGLTKTYNLFHDPGEMSEEMVELRRLHDMMDRAVLGAYGWTEINPTCCFFPEFDDQDNDDDGAFRYRWPDEIRDDVLARLLVLNQQRYQEEVLAGLHDKADDSRRPKPIAEDESVENQGELDL
jgi:hypothetical protein